MIIRVRKNKNYTTMSNYHLRDKNLSLKAKGLMSVMLSLPDDWDYSIDGLLKILNDGVTIVRNSLKELEKNNYLIRQKIRNEKGKIIDWEYNLFENPLLEKPQVEKPQVEKPQVENQTQINTNIQNINILNTNNKESKKDETFDDIINSMCQNEELKNAIYDFIKMRKVIKKPLTNRALKSIITRLNKLSGGDNNKGILILDQSIRNGWQDVYELKEKNNINMITRELKKEQIDNLYDSLDNVEV